MHSYRFLIISLVLFSFLDATAAVPQPLQIRQDENPSERPDAPSSTKSDSPVPSSSAVQSSGPSSAKPQSERPSPTPSDVVASTTISITTTAAAPDPTAGAQDGAVSSADANSANPLPIHPKITPAMGLTGVILLLSGAVYAFIGIKNKWLYVFFSTAYLTSLAVTVLIVYLMSPPVSNAIQGAFFVAAFLSGLILGALSLVFSDITDGLGCLLGGFCLSMWFLTLKEGGLITSTTGRAIFISCMSVAGFSLSFSHYTRNYGLIVCISFAGATITMLGVDCLSRAGWKEFWLYLWDLNENIFPLHTNTYPITRGIKVEIACVILLTVFGIISQLKLWKLVKERREKTAALRLERDQNLEREEEEVGRKIEDDFSRERAQWEALYGDRAQQQDSVMESSNRSTPKTSTSVQERELSPTESMELATLPPMPTASLRENVTRPTSKSLPPGSAVTVTVLQEEDEIRQMDTEGNPPPQSKRASQMHAQTLGLASSNARNSTDIEPAGAEDPPRSASTRSSPRSSVPPPPVVVPLPFTVPEEDDTRSIDADNASVSAVPESVQGSLLIRRSLSKRLSGGSMLKRLSASRGVPEEGDEEVLIVPHIEDDRASSLAATLDDDYETMSLSDISAPQSPMHSGFDQTFAKPEDGALPTIDLSGGEMPSIAGSTLGGELDDTTASQSLRSIADRTPEDKDKVPVASIRMIGAAMDSSSTEATIRQSLTVSTEPKPGATVSSRTTHRQRSDTMVSQEEGEEDYPSKSPKSPKSPKSTRSGAPSTHSQTGSQIGLSKEVLPEKLSKIALSYRTNEWAKHLETAERPDLDEIPEPESPGVQLAHDSKEQAAPVSDELKGITPKPKSKPASKRASTESNAYRNSNSNINIMRSASNISRTSFVDPSASRTSILAPAALSRPPSVSQTRGLRSSSSPYLASGPDISAARLSSTPSPIANPTLMGQREALVRNKVSSQSFTPLSSSPNLISELEQENMTLAQRKQFIQHQNQHQKPPSASAAWRQSSWGTGAANSQAFDSHQPRRMSGGMDPARREVMLANWRESMRQDAAPATGTGAGEEARRLALINERRQKEAEKQQRATIALQRESMMDNMMRSGEMLDAHREAMRRMQAKANRNAS